MEAYFVENLANVGLGINVFEVSNEAGKMNTFSSPAQDEVGVRVCGMIGELEPEMDSIQLDF